MNNRVKSNFYEWDQICAQESSEQVIYQLEPLGHKNQARQS